MTFDEWFDYQSKKTLDNYTAQKAAWAESNRQWIEAIVAASPDIDQPFGTTVPARPEEFADCLKEWLEDVIKKNTKTKINNKLNTCKHESETHTYGSVHCDDCGKQLWPK